jgi:hypothetical protein
MPTTYKILGQQNPSASTLTTVYTVPAATQAVVSTITCANFGATSSNVSLSVHVANAAWAANMQVANNISVGTQNSLALTLGVTLGAGDTIRANCSTANIAVNIFGSEIS